MSHPIFTDKLIEDVITGLKKCSDPIHANCCECPWAHHPHGCRTALGQGALIILEHYQSREKVLEGENKKLTYELESERINRDKLLDELMRMEKELSRYKEQEQKALNTPTMILHTEPVKIESIDYNKFAKAADKATKACEKLTKALDELDKQTTIHIDLPFVSQNSIRAQFGIPPYHPKPQEIAKVGDIFSAVTPSYGVRYHTVTRVCPDGIYNTPGSRFMDTIREIFRKDENGNLKLIWKRK